MSVSGLGSPSAGRAVPTTAARAAAAYRVSTVPQRDTSLTDRDRALVHEVTGRRAEHDSGSGWSTALAAAIAADRGAGRLTPGQEVSPAYLRDLCRRFDRAGAANPIAPYLDRALRHLEEVGGHQVDLTA